MTRFRTSLFLKMLGAFILVVLLVGALVTVMARRATRDQFAVYTTGANQRQAEALAAFMAEYYAINGSWDGVETFLASTRPILAEPVRGPGGRGMRLRGIDIWRVVGSRAVVADVTGEVVADSAGEMSGQQLDAEALARGVAIVVNEEQVGTAVATDWDRAATQNRAFLQDMNQAIFLAVGIAAAIALLLAVLITWGMIRPLRQLTGAAEAIADGELAQRVPIRSNDEIGDLAVAFNQMSDRLARAETLRRQMTADIAHELRTPLTVIQGNVEALQDGVFPLDQSALQPIAAKTSLLIRLVEDLRQLALAEAGQLRLDKTVTDLALLAAHTRRAFQPTAESKQINLDLDAPPDLPAVVVDPLRIEQVLMNLLSNALRHTPPNGRVTLTLTAEPGQIRISVRDTGPGLTPEAAVNVFERFYRVDQGRAREADGRGTGLGLAVAKSIVAAHSGQIGVAATPGAGATFWFTLPLT